jgi:hypothetical protein
MPLHISWDNDEKTIIRCEGEGKWTWDDYHDALNQVMDMAKTVSNRVDLIIVQKPGSITPRGSGQPHYERALKIRPDNFGMNVVITQSTLARTMVDIWSKVPGNKLAGQIKLVASLEDAYAVIDQEQAKTQATSGTD